MFHLYNMRKLVDVGNATNGWEWEQEKVDQEKIHLI